MPEYGKALNRIRSGVEVPELGCGGRGGCKKEESFGGRLGEVGEEGCDGRRPLIVVVRGVLVVFAEGGGGSPASSSRSLEGRALPLAFALSVMLCKVGKMLARHRKHSPVP